MLKTTTPTCAYCGKQFKELKIKGHDLSKLPAESKLIVRNHVMQCPENPLVKVNTEQADQIVKLKKKIELYESVMGKDPLSDVSAETYCKIVTSLKERIERMKELSYMFQLTGNDAIVQFEFQHGNKELEIEFGPEMKIGYLKVRGDWMEEGEVESPQQIFQLLQWFKAAPPQKESEDKNELD